MKSNTLYVLCGLPGSGKTTYSKKLAENTESKLYSFDEYSGANKPSESRQVKQQMYQDIYNDLNAGCNVILDDLHTQKIWREDIISIVKDIPCQKILVVITTPFEECLARNSKRQGIGRLPDFVIKILNQKYEVPTLNEGWDEIITK